MTNEPKFKLGRQAEGEGASTSKQTEHFAAKWPPFRIHAWGLTHYTLAIIKYATYRSSTACYDSKKRTNRFLSTLKITCTAIRMSEALELIDICHALPWVDTQNQNTTYPPWHQGWLKPTFLILFELGVLDEYLPDPVAEQRYTVWLESLRTPWATSGESSIPVPARSNKIGCQDAWSLRPLSLPCPIRNCPLRSQIDLRHLNDARLRVENR